MRVLRAEGTIAMTTSLISKQTEYIEQISPSSPFYLLFEHLPGISFFAKNAEFELMCANTAFLERLGLTSESEIIGKTDYELFPKSLAEHFRADDEWVLRTGQAKLHIVELFINPDGLPDWYLTNKLAVRGKNGAVIGVMGTTQNYQYDKRFIQPYLQIEPAIDYIRRNFREMISVKEIAEEVGLSVRQLERRFQEILKMSPREFITKLRIKTACEELTRGNDSILQIALSLGFYDQSSFTMQFRQHMGVTPLHYRKQHQSGVGGEMMGRSA